MLNFNKVLYKENLETKKHQVVLEYLIREY